MKIYDGKGQLFSALLGDGRWNVNVNINVDVKVKVKVKSKVENPLAYAGSCNLTRYVRSLGLRRSILSPAAQLG